MTPWCKNYSYTMDETRNQHSATSHSNDDVILSVSKTQSCDALDDNHDVILSVNDDVDATDDAVKNDQLFSAADDSDENYQHQASANADPSSSADQSGMLTIGTSPGIADLNPVSWQSEKHDLSTALYEPEWRPPPPARLISTNSDRGGGGKTSLITRMLRRKKTNPGTGRGGDDDARGRYGTPQPAQHRWQLTSRSVNQLGNSNFPSGGAAVRHNFNPTSANNFHDDVTALTTTLSRGNNTSTAAELDKQQQHQEMRQDAKPISSEHAGHVAAKYFGKLELDDEHQVFGYVREGDKIKPLVHRNNSRCNGVQGELEACVVQCDGRGTVAYHRWRGVHGIIFPPGSSAAADEWGSIDISEHFATTVPPIYTRFQTNKDTYMQLPIANSIRPT